MTLPESLAAGRQAETAFDWSLAASHYRAGLAEIGEAEERSAERAALHHGLGRSLGMSGEYRDAWRNLMAASQLYRNVGDAEAFARLTSDAASANPQPARIESLVAEALDMHGGADTLTTRRLRVMLALIGIATRQDDSLIGEIRSVEQVIGPDERECAGLIERAYAIVAERSGDRPRAVAHAERSFEHLTAAESRFLLGGPWGSGAAADLGRHALWVGDIEAAIRWQDQARDEAIRRGAVFEAQNLRGVDAFMRALRGDFAPALDLAAQETGPGNAMSLLPAAVVADATGVTTLQGRLPDPELAGGVPAFVQFVRGVRARTFAVLGRSDEAREEVTAVMEVVRRLPFPIGISILDRSLLLVDRDHIAWAYERLEQFPDLRFAPQGCVDRLRGDLAIAIGRTDDAEKHFTMGLQLCQEQRCPIEAGLCYEGLGDVARTRGDQAAARAHLGSARDLFSHWGATRYLESVTGKLSALGS